MSKQYRDLLMLRRVWILSFLTALSAFVGRLSGGGLEPGRAVSNEPNYSFVFLGDIHFDHPRHHDMEWVKENHPKDIVQIQNYSRITAENTPLLFESISKGIKQRHEKTFSIIQAGDFVEGLCGSYELQSLQFEEAKTFVKGNFADTLFLITKGNHDITGSGADKAYQDQILPWLGGQLKRNIARSSYTVDYDKDLFIFFDAYKPDLDWLEETLGSSTARYTFLIIHKPVVPFNPRSSWHIFAENEHQTERARLLDLLGRYKVIVLCGHLHEFSLLSRTTQSGRFAQLSMSSVISNPDMTAEHYLAGKEKYTSDLVNLEPSHSPGTLDLRKQNLEKERPYIDFFEYAKTAGYGLLRIYPDKIMVEIYSGCGVSPWKTYQLNQQADIECLH